MTAWDFIRFLIVAGIVCGALCAALAPLRGRNFAFWFASGFFINIAGIVLLLCLPDLRHETGFRVRVENENRRLREQLRQERMKAEVFRQYAARRLDAHDAQLGVDTRSAIALPRAGGPVRVLPVGSALALAGDEARTSGINPFGLPPRLPAAARQWYYELNNRTNGPVNESTLHAMIGDGQINGQTLVWAEHLDDWKSLALVSEFEPMLSAVPVPPRELATDATSRQLATDAPPVPGEQVIGGISATRGGALNNLGNNLGNDLGDDGDDGGGGNRGGDRGGNMAGNLGGNLGGESLDPA